MVKKYLTLFLLTLSVASCALEDKVDVKATPSEAVEEKSKVPHAPPKDLSEQGNAEAQFNLGLIYYLGDGIPRDYKEAVKWYTKAAEQGNADAQYNLGVMYYIGEGITQD